ncbi:MAG: glutamine--fructose-6-phosphate transaminase (isomerizing) [Bacilli bacterium]|nr:glutamine--fructose-6-phosphate transaminase (isomerizing) [Bacilli bacterium]
MCGIVGYIGNKSAKEVLLSGLKNLEYRGYDSSGLAFLQNGKIEIIKSVGKISNLEKKLESMELDDYTMGIAHTRWATHGGATLLNAHPHQVGDITLVHNGIIENVDVLKEELKHEGICFQSETDTEVIAVLLNKYLEKDVLKSINQVMNKLKGSFALGIIVKSQDHRLYVVKKDSPLVIGVGEGETFFASDITAINTYTNDFIFLDEGEIAEITKEDVIVYSNLHKVEKKVNTIHVEAQDKDKNGFEHFMLKEIYEEPSVLENTLKKYLDDFKQVPNLSKYEEIHIVACGSAMYAGMIGKTLLEEEANTKSIVEVASEYRYKKNIYNVKTLVILVSQSGETADTIAALRKAKENGQDTLAVVNVKTSTIAREADQCIFIEAGEEIAVATTKAYMLQVAVLSLLALKLSYDKKIVTDIDSYLSDFKKIPGFVKNVIDKESICQKIAKEIYRCEDVFFIGRKIDYAICLEGSLKLKEVSYIHSEAYQAGELKHGTISLIEKGTPVFGIITDKTIAEKTISNIIEVTARGAKKILITTDDLNQSMDGDLSVATINQFLQPLLIVPILQLIAYHTAKLRNCDIDKPKNLAKSVTVE